MQTQILLIEDDADLRAEMQEYLERRGHACLACETVADAKAALGRMQPDVVLSDICLPDGDGLTFCMENAPHHPRARWLLMSGNQDIVRTRQRALGKGISIVDKPLSLRLLNEFICRSPDKMTLAYAA